MCHRQAEYCSTCTQPRYAARESCCSPPSRIGFITIRAVVPRTPISRGPGWRTYYGRGTCADGAFPLARSDNSDDVKIVNTRNVYTYSMFCDSMALSCAASAFSYHIAAAIDGFSSSIEELAGDGRRLGGNNNNRCGPLRFRCM